MFQSSFEDHDLFLLLLYSLYEQRYGIHVAHSERLALIIVSDQPLIDIGNLFCRQTNLSAKVRAIITDKGDRPQQHDFIESIKQRLVIVFEPHRRRQTPK